MTTDSMQEKQRKKKQHCQINKTFSFERYAESPASVYVVTSAMSTPQIDTIAINEKEMKCIY